MSKTYKTNNVTFKSPKKVVLCSAKRMEIYKLSFNLLEKKENFGEN